MARLLLVALALLTSTGCARTVSEPEAVVGTVYEALAQYQLRASPVLLEEAYRRLDAASRAKLEALAKEATAATGAPVEGWEMLGSRGLVAGDRLSGVEVVKAGESEALVAVKFAWWIPEKAGGRPLQPEPVEVRAVREDGQWRVVLPLPL